MLVVIAQPEELTLVKELGFENNPILITGVGGINVINAMRDLPRDIEILNIGYCGSNKYKIGEKLQINVVSTYHQTANFAEKDLNLYLNASEIKGISKCYTSTDFVAKTSIKEPCVFDMELAFIRAMFYNVRSIKVVSDNLNKKEYNKNVGE